MSEAELTDKLARLPDMGGRGVNNIPVELYSKKGVVVFNTPGATRTRQRTRHLACFFRQEKFAAA
jgi:phosphoglycerate dehydrogenase-like enzyme